MAERIQAENAAFWLPTHFLTDDDLLSGDDPDLRILKKDPLTNFDPFFNGFDPFASYSALDSPVSSSETERDNDNGKTDDDELLAELTRQLAESRLQDAHLKSNPTHNLNEKPLLYSTSPQSTLTGFCPWSNRSGFSSNGSPNGPSQVPSPPMTPPGSKSDAAWDLLYEAAGQVARLKMNAIAAQLNQQHHHTRGLLGAPRNPSLSVKSHHMNNFYDYPHAHQFQQVRRQGSAVWPQGRQERAECYCQHHQRRSCGGGNGGALGLPQSAWPPLRARQPQQQPQYSHNHPQQSGTQGESGMRAVFRSGSGSGSATGPAVKRQSTGTGVFIPRRVGTQPETRKKPSGCSNVHLPARVVQALNLDIDEMNNGVIHNTQSRSSPGFVTDHEILMARRNALLSVQRRSSRADGPTTMVGHDIRLPSDWTY